ncbi:MAG: tetratricopeptide repeat protein [candidate division WOR-3 bacterium]
MLWEIFCLGILSQQPDTSKKDTMFGAGTEMEEEVTAIGEYRIKDMRMPLLDPPFNAIEAINLSLAQQGAPEDVISAASSLSSRVSALDTAGALRVAQGVKVKGEYAKSGEFLAAVADYSFGRYWLSAGDLKDFVNKNRGFPLGREARALAVLSYLYWGRFAEGQAVGSVYVKEGEEDVERGFWNGWTIWATGMCSYFKGDYEVAERYFLENITHNSDSLVVLYSRLGAGWCNLHEARPQDAKAQLEIVLLSAPEGSDLARCAELGTAIAVFNMGKYQDAYKRLNEISVPLPRNPYLAAEILYQKGTMGEVMRDYAGSERSWRQVIEDYGNLPQAADAAFRLGQSYAAGGDNEHATAILEWLVKQFPDYPKNDRAIYMLAEMYFSLKDFRSALMKFKEFLARFPNNRLVPDVRERLAQTYYAIALEDESILPEFEREFPNSQELAESYYYWAVKHYEEGVAKQNNSEYDTSAALFHKMALLFPKHRRASDALFYAGQIYFNQKKYSLSADLLDKFIRSYPESEHRNEAAVLVGMSYVIINRPMEAVGLLTDLLNTSSEPADRAVAHHYLGLAYIQLGDVEKALDHLNDAALIYQDLGRMEDLETINKIKKELVK